MSICPTSGFRPSSAVPAASRSVFSLLLIRLSTLAHSSSASAVVPYMIVGRGS